MALLPAGPRDGLALLHSPTAALLLVPRRRGDLSVTVFSRPTIAILHGPDACVTLLLLHSTALGCSELALRGEARESTRPPAQTLLFPA